MQITKRRLAYASAAVVGGLLVSSLLAADASGRRQYRLPDCTYYGESNCYDGWRSASYDRYCERHGNRKLKRCHAYRPEEPGFGDGVYIWAKNLWKKLQDES
jgi:hypothetical protein